MNWTATKAWKETVGKNIYFELVKGDTSRYYQVEVCTSHGPRPHVHIKFYPPNLFKKVLTTLVETQAPEVLEVAKSYAVSLDHLDIAYQKANSII